MTGPLDLAAINEIADALRVSGSLTQVLAFLSAVLLCLSALTAVAVCVQINLSNNALCGVVNTRYGTQGTHNAEGIKVIADAIRVSTSLTSINLSANKISLESSPRLTT
eukprot:2355843-Prymnesium_polylepis.1